MGIEAGSARTLALLPRAVAGAAAGSLHPMENVSGRLNAMMLQ
jgi:hypothetical protein